MRWLVLGWVVLLVACAGGPSLPTTSTTTAPALSAVATTVPVRPTTPALARTPQAGVVSKPFHISSVDSAFFLAGIVTGTLQIDSKLIHVSIDEATFIHRDTGAYTGSVELTSIRADLTEYIDARPVHVINETAPLPLHNTSRPGEHITVHNLRFSITRAGAERLDRYALGFRVDVRSTLLIKSGCFFRTGLLD
jgi:hypothetical protein